MSTYNALMISDKDNVVVVIKPVIKGDKVSYLNHEDVCEVVATNDIPINHKMAIHEIAKGGEVFKYGQPIGIASENVHVGEHVHNHNIVSVRESITVA